MQIAVRVAAAIAAGLTCGVGLTATAMQSAPRPTIVVRFAIDPASLPHVALKGACGPSTAAWFRTDARQCTSGAKVYDPCFTVAPKPQATTSTLLCDVDPRKPSSGVFVEEALAPPSQPGGFAPSHRSHTVWLFELADGTTCRPVAGPVREIEGQAELYSCVWGSDGQADAVLGELSSGQLVWTIQKVLINKKTEPQTIKSMTMAIVKSVWQ